MPSGDPSTEVIAAITAGLASGAGCSREVKRGALAR
jgi:hypothetical protein